MFQFMIISLCRMRPCDDNHISGCREYIFMKPCGFLDPSFDSVTDYAVSDFFTDGYSQPDAAFCMLQHINDEIAVGF